MYQHWKTAGTYSTLGLEVALSVMVGLFFGQWLDKKFETRGLLTGVWFFFGLVAAGRAIYRALQRANREAEAEETAARNASAVNQSQQDTHHEL